MPAQDREQALALLATVVESSPDHTDAARLFGYLCLFAEARLEEGLDVVETALGKRRGNSNLLLILAQLFAKKGRVADAISIYEALLKRQLEPNTVAFIRRQLDFLAQP